VSNVEIRLIEQQRLLSPIHGIEDSRMKEISFAPKETIPPEKCRMEILDAYMTDTYGLQLGLKLKVLGGEHDGHTFTDYCSRDEVTGQIKQGSKAWAIFEACLGQGFYKRPGASLESLIGKQIVAQVTQTRTGSRNKVEFGTIGPVPPDEKNRPSGPDRGDRDFSDTSI
jgi:hypothetical protein